MTRGVCSRCFTLIELMAVLTMVLLLAGLLLPALRQARQQGQRVTCMGNLRQLGASMMMYCQDHDWRLPPYMGTIYGHGGTNWGSYLRPYYMDVRVLDCPTSPDGPPLDSLRGLHLQDGNYGWNYDGTQGCRGPLYGRISEPSRGYLLFDSGDPCVMVGANRWSNLMEELDLDWVCGDERANRHTDQLCVYFADGHVASLKLLPFLAAPCDSDCAPWYIEWEGGRLEFGVIPYPGP